MSSSSSSSESGDSSLSGCEADNREDAAEALLSLRPTREEYLSYTAIVHDIDKGDTLLAKRIIATHNQQTNASDTADAEASISSRWPLRPTDLSKLHDPDGLEESILAFASAYIREHRLVLPRLAHSMDDDQLDRNVIELDEILPSLLPDMMSKVDKLLNNLAVMRPPAVRTKRRDLKPMGWGAVLSAGMLGYGNDDHHALSNSNSGIRGMLKVQGEDALAHRLDLLQTLNPIAKAEDKQDAPAQATKKRRENPFRSHQSQREREERAAKRERRAAQRLERAQAKAELQAAKRLSKSDKRRQRRPTKS